MKIYLEEFFNRFRARNGSIKGLQYTFKAHPDELYTVLGDLPGNKFSRITSRGVVSKRIIDSDFQRQYRDVSIIRRGIVTPWSIHLGKQYIR